MELWLAIAAFLALTMACRYVGAKCAYRRSHWFFELSHFMSGFLVAAIFANFISDKPQIVLATLWIGLVYEIYELAIVKFPSVRKLLTKMHLKMGPITPADTLLDILLDLAGAILFVTLFSSS